MNKIVANTFKHHLLNYIGIEAKKIDILNSERFIYNKKYIPDVLVRIKNTIIDLEFHTGKTKTKNLKNYLGYQVAIMSDYPNLEVETQVMITEDVEKSVKEYKTKNITFSPNFWSYKSLNANEKINKIDNKIHKQQEINEEEMIDLIYLPYMESKKSKVELLLKSCQLTNKVKGPTKEQLKAMKTCQLLIMEKYVKNESEKKKLMKVIKMKLNIVQRLKLEGEKEGIEKGVEKGVEKVAKNMKKTGETPKFISKMTGLDHQTIEKL